MTDAPHAWCCMRDRDGPCPDDMPACYPRGCAAPGQVPCQCNTRGSLSKLKSTPPQTKINVTSKSPVGDISVVTLIRTDTTLDHSQKAEKVCILLGCRQQRTTLTEQRKMILKRFENHDFQNAQNVEENLQNNEQNSGKMKNIEKRGQNLQRHEQKQRKSWGPKLPQKLKESH